MDSQDHRIAATSTGQEGHGVHLCHRCGWPFPNPHPSAKHRRAHRRVCGTIEGYKVILSEGDDHHLLVVSDDEHASDDDEHTPSPNPMKKNVAELGSSGALSRISTRSEDDLFTDAATEFSDSGISPQSVEQFESEMGLNKGAEQKGLESDFPGIGSVKVNETADKTEPYNDATDSKETRNLGALVNANDQSRNVLPTTDSGAEAVSVGLENSLRDDVIKSEIPRDVVEDNVKKYVSGEIQHDPKKAGQDLDIQGEEQKLSSVNVDSKERIVSDPALIAVEKQEKFHDKLASEMVEPDMLPLTKPLPSKDASAEAERATVSAETSFSARTAAEIALAEETCENSSVSAGVEKVPVSEVDIEQKSDADHILLEESQLGRPLVKPAERSLSPDATEPSDTAFSIKEEIEQKSSFIEVGTAGNDTSNREICEVDGNENQNQKFEHKYLVQTVSAPGSADDTSVGEDERTTKVPKGDVDYCEEKFDRKSLDAVIGKGGEDAEEVKVILDATILQSAANAEELSMSKSSTVESNPEKSFQGQNSDELIQELHSVGSVNTDTRLNDNVDVLDKKSVTETPEYPVSQVGLESALIAGASESTSEQPISKESTLTYPEFVNENSTEESGYIEKGVRELDNAKVSAELNPDGNVTAYTEIPESTREENLCVKKCLDETLPDAEERNINEDTDKAKPSVAPSVKETELSTSHFQGLHETSATADDKDVINVEGENKLIKPQDVVTAMDLPDNSRIESKSLDGNCGAVSADRDKSDVFEPPSFMTLVQSSDKSDHISTASEIETVQNNQHPKPEALQAGWFPSITNMVNDSEGRKKNEEIIAKVTNSSPVKHHSPLKNLLTEAKSPNTKKHETVPENNGVGTTTGGSVVAPEAPEPNDHDTQKHIDEWNSPARYPIETKKEKRKAKSYWVPFMCCSSVHKDL